MNSAPAAQQYWSTNYQNNPDVVFLGIDDWNGTAAQVVNIFQAQTGVQFTCLTNGATPSSAYGASKNYFIIDTEGIVQFISPPHTLNPTTFTNTIETGLQVLQPSASLGSFSLTQVGANVQLDWQTQTETDNEGFIVHRSEDNSFFYAIASYANDPSLVGAGTTTTPQNYTFTDVSVTANTTYYYKLTAVKTGGNEYSLESIIPTITVLPTNLEEEKNLPNGFSLSQNFPNPFNPTTSINYELEITNYEFAKLVIFNVLGEVVNEFVLENSTGSVVWDGKDFKGNLVSSGTYLYRIETNNFISDTKKSILIK
ncbi:MAG: T9SS C-terminal target domain-containing protein [Calditrichaeota bacterium]|nr:MAG: T9SS C-terminal target domain-containing protein [Calditrichota bacterium]